MGVINPLSFALQDFRRGHAQDLLEAGASLGTILRAGEWRSSAFMAYLDVSVMEAKAVLEAHWAQSSGEEDEAPQVPE